ncbi:MAG: hypothetical protein BWX88_03686 [Planctomycetes bacterium ADurb.Bin126]|nr:MAG: hypothetical protein BWX88_03686 [Planctomycetes bacterium ADurb.Bin126]HOD82758.1 hypothetical protein [Phycisphaerae bacterium]HQL73393.1 hypothetical protein [Phycisphaerae bacterium]
MKNATAYERKVKKLLSGASKSSQLSVRDDCMEVLMQGILQADASRRQAERALDTLLEEFVDVNELRVAPHKEITDCMGRDFPRAREKAETLTGVLNRIFDHSTTLSLDYVHELPKREIRRHLKELGLDTYASALLMLASFSTHALPVDQMLVDCLAADGLIHPGSDPADVQGFLERIVSQKDSRSAHEFLRAYAEKRSKSLPPKRTAAEAPAEAEATGLAEQPAKAAKPKAAKPKAKSAGKTPRKAAAKASKPIRKPPTKTAGKTKASSAAKPKPKAKVKPKPKAKVRTKPKAKASRK